MDGFSFRCICFLVSAISCTWNGLAACIQHSTQFEVEAILFIEPNYGKFDEIKIKTLKKQLNLKIVCRSDCE